MNVKQALHCKLFQYVRLSEILKRNYTRSKYLLRAHSKVSLNCFLPGRMLGNIKHKLESCKANRGKIKHEHNCCHMGEAHLTQPHRRLSLFLNKKRNLPAQLFPLFLLLRPPSVPIQNQKNKKGKAFPITSLSHSLSSARVPGSTL